MAGINADHILDIDRKLAELTLIPSERCIFRVHDVLRNENKKAYEPEVVAIGPYHHGKDNLQPMEEHKLRYLKRLLNRRNETSAERYIVAMRESEQKARKSYADPTSLDSNKFVEMMLLDGCFIVELLRKNEKKINPIATERPAKPGGKPGRPERPDRPDDKPSRTDRPGDKLGCELLQDHLSINHLLGLLHYCCCYQFHSTVFSRSNPDGIKEESLKSATELQETGIKFENIEGETLFGIRFEEGILKIPTLKVEDDTESVFRNLIAYEQYHPDTSWHHFTAYHKFMDYLVNTSKDVEILTHCGIIRSLLGENEVVATMLNKLGNNIIISDLGYEEVYNNVNEHCRGKWNIRFAILRRDYFNTPWASISFVAAVVLLLLTVLQTIFSIHPIGKSN
ncbi:hypothetical protein CsSME_00020476 [Camellia sinensis var. sinensis]